MKQIQSCSKLARGTSDLKQSFEHFRTQDLSCSECEPALGAKGIKAMFFSCWLSQHIVLRDNTYNYSFIISLFGTFLSLLFSSEVKTLYVGFFFPLLYPEEIPEMG